MKDGRLGIALVGLGYYSENLLAPALQQTQHCYLSGIVTGSPEKIDEWKAKYPLPDSACYRYENFDSIKDNPDVDIVYIVLPNSMHEEYVIRAARARKHVICEKPMAITVEECDRMIAACKDAGKMLSIGYRLQFEPHHKEVMRLKREKTFGPIRSIQTAHSLSDAHGWRIDKNLAGGGPLVDVGIYCVQAARYATGNEPIAVLAQEEKKTKPEKFKDIEESLSFQLEMPVGVIVQCHSSYSKQEDYLRIETEKGEIELKPAYAYTGIKGNTPAGKMDFSQVNQQALQMDDFAVCIKENKPTSVSGEEGKQDVKILSAIYQAMRTGERIVIE